MYNCFMSINKDLRHLLLNEAKTIKQLAEMANEVSGKKFSADGISQKLNKGTMKYDEAKFLAHVLGYEIEFKKIN